jgi:hypothetical protein
VVNSRSASAIRLRRTPSCFGGRGITLTLAGRARMGNAENQNHQRSLGQDHTPAAGILAVPPARIPSESYCASRAHT